jgi:hypothetical protein
MVDGFIDFIGESLWSARVRAIERQGALGPRSGKAILQRHAIECMLERLRRGVRTPSTAERRTALLAADAVESAERLSRDGRARWRKELRRALEGENTLLPAFHKLRSAAVQRARGFQVHFAGLEDAACFDLLLTRGGIEAELSCDVVSAEDGRSVHRGAWFRFADGIDADLQTWLTGHPGRYLLKMTLPEGLRAENGNQAAVARLQERIRQLLADCRRADHDEAVVLRLDPLLLAGAQLGDARSVSLLRQEFGPEAQLAVVAGDGGVFVVAARAGRENEIAAVVRRRMAAIAPRRLTGTRPGILAMFIEDTDRAEWRALRERLELEGEARQFMTDPAARSVVAVSCTSRLELFGLSDDDAAPGGELRFRNPAHPAARCTALAPAVVSSV